VSVNDVSLVDLFFPSNLQRKKKTEKRQKFKKKTLSFAYFLTSPKNKNFGFFLGGGKSIFFKKEAHPERGKSRSW
jgi:hypothetical protein